MNTSITSDYDTTTLPTGWTTPSGGGLNLVSTSQADSRGRTTESTDPNGNVTYTVYNDSFDAGTGFVDEVRVYPGWHLDTSTGLYTTTGPVQVMRTNRTYSYTESLTYTAPQLSSSTPDGTDSISASNMQSLSRSIMNDAGQVIESDDYFSLAGITYSATSVHLGSPSDVSTSGNYSATTYSYDFHGLQDKVVSPNGTITRTIYDGQNRVTSKWVGTNDTPATGYWSPSNNTSPSNMVMVEQDAYDTQSAPAAPSLGSTTGGSLSSRTGYVKISYISTAWRPPRRWKAR